MPLQNSPTYTIPLRNKFSLRIWKDDHITLQKPHEEIDITTTDNERDKICSLEHLYANLRYGGRNNLDPERECNVVSRIIKTFSSKTTCVSAISQYAVASESKGILNDWAKGVWGIDSGKGEENGDDKDEESPAGSLFSDSDVEKRSSNRIRPLTLRRRSTISIKAGSLIPKAEPSSESRAPTSSKPYTLQFSSALKQIVGSSEGIRVKPRKDAATPASLSSTPSERPRLSELPTAVAPKKRPSKAAEPDPSRKKPRISNPEEQKMVAQQQIEDPVRGISFATKEETSQNYVSRYWKEVSAKFPAEIRELSTVERLAYYFRETELIRQENEVIRRDELERRKSMVLLGEKIN